MIALAVMVATPSSLIDDELYRNQIFHLLLVRLCPSLWVACML